MNTSRRTLKSFLCGTVLNTMAQAVSAAPAVAVGDTVHPTSVSPFVNALPVPEPATLLVSITGVGAMFAFRRMFSRRR